MSMPYALHFYEGNLNIGELRDLPNVAWARQCGASTGLHFYESTSATSFTTQSRYFLLPWPFYCTLIQASQGSGWRTFSEGSNDSPHSHGWDLVSWVALKGLLLSVRFLEEDTQFLPFQQTFKKNVPPPTESVSSVLLN